MFEGCLHGQGVTSTPAPWVQKEVLGAGAGCRAGWVAAAGTPEEAWCGARTSRDGCFHDDCFLKIHLVRLPGGVCVHVLMDCTVMSFIKNTHKGIWVASRWGTQALIMGA